MESSLQYFFKVNVFLCSHLSANSSALELGATKMKKIVFTDHVYAILTDKCLLSSQALFNQRSSFTMQESLQLLVYLCLYL